ncbi:MAG: RHS repeat-associated core domain-containing protein, partial [Flavobacterium sp.]
RNRLVEQRLPGKQWEFIVYDKLNRPIVTGPALNPFDGNNWGWIFTKYDAFGRVAYTGWFTGAYTRSNLQNANNGAVSIATRIDSTIDGVPVNYSNTNIPTNLILLTVNYYDDYKYPDAPSFVDVLDQPVLKHPTGLSTGSWVRVLTAGGTLQKETSYVFYDYDGRVVRTYRKNYIGGYTYVDSFLDFIGKTLYSVTKHKYSDDGEELVIREDFTYSLQDRLVNHTHQIKEDPLQLIAHNTYDELGQLINKKVGGLNVSGEEGLQTVDYSYNIRGWLTGINDFDTVNMENDLFAFKINYNKPEPEAPTAALFNGNISETLWKTSSDKILRKYEYSYDYLNRLLQADYKKPDNAHGTNNYLEQLSYDKSGNILTLHRNGDLDSDVHTNEIDDLIYSYHPDKKNQLMKVFDSSANPQGFKDDSNGINDSADDYNYDLNGNMIADTNKGISITYNHLNLPMLINFNANGGKINYIYDAVGTKLKKIVEVSGNPIEYYYINGFQYMKDKLLFFPHAEGYISYVSAVEGGVPESFNYVFNYTDHLGNIRLSYGVNPNFPSKTMIFEENNYYPFGLKHSNYNVYWVEKEDYKYKYNGFEYQDELGLNVYDYGARNYDPALGRWMNIDPLAETSRRWSPYAYCYNNPLRFTDPDGMQADDVIIKGEGADKTLAQLQKSTSLTLSMNSDGKVTATGEAKTAADKELQAATTDKNVTVNLNSTLGNQSTDGSGDYLSSSGSFDGSTVNADGTATANQTVNPDFAAAVDNFEGTPEGAGVLHETLEGYQEGKRAQETQTPSGPAIPGTPGYANYLKAHNKADAIDPRHIRVGEPDRGLRKDGTLWQGLFKPSGDFLPLYQVKK